MKSNKFKTILLCIVIVFIGNYLILSLLPKFIATIFLLSSTNLTNKYIVGILVRVIGISFGLIFVNKINIKLNYSFKFKKEYLFISWIFIIYIIANIEFVNITNNMILNLILMIIDCLSVGLYEELIFRGIIFNLILKEYKNTDNGIFLSIIMSSTLFGLIHFMNISSIIDFAEVLYQVVYSTIIGIYFCAMYVRTDCNLLWCSIIHAFYDISSGFGDLIPKTNSIPSTNLVQTANIDISSYFIEITTFIPLLIYSFFIIRKK